jgi:hypothetical protein
MIVTVMFNGKPFGSPMDGLRDDDLLWFIKSQLELGRTVQITPEEQDIFDERGDV